jgi:predicted porin
MSNLKLNAKYIHKDINNPATNIEPDHSDEGQLRLTWMPLPALITFISYDIKKEKRDSVDFVNYDTGGIETADNRKVDDDRIIGTVSYVFSKDLSATASYAYIHNRVRQDIRLSSDDPAYWDSQTPYKTTAHSYSFDVRYSPKSFISMDAGVNHTISQGAFYTSASNLQDIPVFSDLKTRETTYSATGEYRFRCGYTAGIQYRYTTFNDALNNIYDGLNDGRVSIILLTISKKW